MFCSGVVGSAASVRPGSMPRISNNQKRVKRSIVVLLFYFYRSDACVAAAFLSLTDHWLSGITPKNDLQGGTEGRRCAAADAPAGTRCAVTGGRAVQSGC